MKTVLVSLPDGVNAIIEKELMGKVGESKSEVVRTLVVAQLMGLGYIGRGKNYGRKKEKRKTGRN